MRNSVHVEAIALAGVLAGMLAGATAVTGARRRAPSDREIQTAVTRQLQDHHLRRGDNPSVAVSDGTVTLAGQLQSLWEKNEAISVARKVDGVRSLVSDLTITRAESDKAIAEALTKRVLQYDKYTIFDDVNVGVLNGVVTLSGAVTLPLKADELVNAASRVQGVQDVKNAFKLLPLSPNDNRLRSELANRIFRNDILAVYGRGANPSIHIIVENGRVTLKGYVDTAIDKQQADVIVRGIPGVFGVDNQLQVNR